MWLSCQGSRISLGGVVFCYSPSRCSHSEMARGLYETEPCSPSTFDKCAAGFPPERGIDLVQRGSMGPDRIGTSDRAQPASSRSNTPGAADQLLRVRGPPGGPPVFSSQSIVEYAAPPAGVCFDLVPAIKSWRCARGLHARPPPVRCRGGDGVPDDIAVIFTWSRSCLGERSRKLRGRRFAGEHSQAAGKALDRGFSRGGSGHRTRSIQPNAQVVPQFRGGSVASYSCMHPPHTHRFFPPQRATDDRRGGDRPSHVGAADTRRRQILPTNSI